MWRVIVKILLGVYLVVATYFAWQYFSHREELAICLDYPKERLVEIWEEQKAVIEKNVAESEEKQRQKEALKLNEASATAQVSSESGVTASGIETASESAVIVEEKEEEKGFWESLQERFWTLIGRGKEGVEKVEKVASESAIIVEEGKAVAGQAQELYEKTQVVIDEVKK